MKFQRSFKRSFKQSFPAKRPRALSDFEVSRYGVENAFPQKEGKTASKRCTTFSAGDMASQVGSFLVSFTGKFTQKEKISEADSPNLTSLTNKKKSTSSQSGMPNNWTAFEANLSSQIVNFRHKIASTFQEKFNLPEKEPSKLPSTSTECSPLANAQLTAHLTQEEKQILEKVKQKDEQFRKEGNAKVQSYVSPPTPPVILNGTPIPVFQIPENPTVNCAQWSNICLSILLRKQSHKKEDRRHSALVSPTKSCSIGNISNSQRRSQSQDGVSSQQRASQLDYHHQSALRQNRRRFSIFQPAFDSQFASKSTPLILINGCDNSSQNKALLGRQQSQSLPESPKNSSLDLLEIPTKQPNRRCSAASKAENKRQMPQVSPEGHSSPRRQLPALPSQAKCPQTVSIALQSAQILLFVKLNEEKCKLSIVIVSARGLEDHPLYERELSVWVQLRLLPELGFNVCRTKGALAFQWNECLEFTEFPLDKVDEIILDLSLWCGTSLSLASTRIPLRIALFGLSEWWPLVPTQVTYLQAPSVSLPLPASVDSLASSLAPTLSASSLSRLSLHKAHSLDYIDTNFGALLADAFLTSQSTPGSRRSSGRSEAVISMERIIESPSGEPAEQSLLDVPSNWSSWQSLPLVSQSGLHPNAPLVEHFNDSKLRESCSERHNPQARPPAPLSCQAKSESQLCFHRPNWNRCCQFLTIRHAQ